MKVINTILPIGGLIYLFFHARQNNDIIHFVSFQLVVLFLLAALLFSIDKRMFLSKTSVLIVIALLIASFILYLIFKLNITISTTLFLGLILLLQLVKITSRNKLKQ